MRFEKIAILLFSLLSFTVILLGMWTIDISCSGISLKSAGIDVQVTNGWWTRDVVQQYHIGLWMVGLGALLMMICVIVGVEVCG